VSDERVPEPSNSAAADLPSLIEPLPGRIDKALVEMLMPSEVVLLKLKGAFKEGLVCTDSRVLILKGGFMTGQTLGNSAFQQPYSNISGVQVKYHLASGYFEVNSGGMQNTAKSYWSTDKDSDPAKAPNCVSLNSKKQAARFREASSFILARIDAVKSEPKPQAAAMQPPTHEDVIASIERLGKLKESGVLTEQEFQEKKAELLARL
jgi:hypothetical protein